MINFSDINKIDYTYQENLKSLLESKLNIFNLPIKLKSKHDIANKEVDTEIDLNTLRLIIKNIPHFVKPPLSNRAMISFESPKHFLPLCERLDQARPF